MGKPLAQLSADNIYMQKIKAITDKAIAHVQSRHLNMIDTGKSSNSGREESTRRPRATKEQLNEHCYKLLADNTDVEDPALVRIFEQLLMNAILGSGEDTGRVRQLELETHTSQINSAATNLAHRIHRNAVVSIESDGVAELYNASVGE